MESNQVQKALKPIIDNIRKTCIVPECQSEVSDSQLMGLLVSKYFEWDGQAIAETSGYALEDANYHELAAVLFKMAK